MTSSDTRLCALCHEHEAATRGGRAHISRKFMQHRTQPRTSWLELLLCAMCVCLCCACVRIDFSGKHEPRCLSNTARDSATKLVSNIWYLRRSLTDTKHQNTANASQTQNKRHACSFTHLFANRVVRTDALRRAAQLGKCKYTRL